MSRVNRLDSFGNLQAPMVQLECNRKIKDYVSSCFTVKTLKKKLPILTWLPKYSFYNLQCDFIAGLTVGLTVLPQGLAYAKIARLPPQYGLYSAFMGCVVYCFLGTSKDITIGPTAIMSLMTAAFAKSPIEGDPTYAIILTLMCGAVQFLLGVFNLGIIVSFISYPVINAFTSAAAITIAFGQVKGILGLSNIPRDFLNCVYQTFAKIGETNYMMACFQKASDTATTINVTVFICSVENVWDLTMGLCCILLLFLLKKLRTVNWGDDGNDLSMCQKLCRKLIWLMGTGANAVVVVSSALVAAAVESENLHGKITLTGHLKQGLPPFRAPDFSLHQGNVTASAGDIFKSIGAGFAIVPLLGLVEAIAIGRAFARQNNYKIEPTQELIAIGVANMMSCLVSSYPVTGSFSRTAVNSQSGVRTPAAGLFTAGLVLLSLQVLTPLFYYIPKAALSAVIISAVLQMVDYKILLKLWKTQKLDLFPLLITFISSLVIGIEYGILVGIGLSLIMLLYPLARPKLNIDNYDIPVIQLSHGLNFPAVEYLEEHIEEILSSDVKAPAIIIDCTHLYDMDYTSLQGFASIVADAHQVHVDILFAKMRPSVLSAVMLAEIPGFIYSSTVEGARTLVNEGGRSRDMEIEVDEDNPAKKLLDDRSGPRTCYT